MFAIGALGMLGLSLTRPGGEQVQCRALLAPREHSRHPGLCDNRRFRGVAQPGSALRSGRRGPQFESGHPDALPGPQRGPGSRLLALDSAGERSPRRDPGLPRRRARDAPLPRLRADRAAGDRRRARRARRLRRLLHARGVRPGRSRGRAAAARAPRHVLGQRAARRSAPHEAPARAPVRRGHHARRLPPAARRPSADRQQRPPRRGAAAARRRLVLRARRASRSPSTGRSRRPCRCRRWPSA